MLNFKSMCWTHVVHMLKSINLIEDVQKHWQWCEMKQIMNAEVTSLHLAQRAMVPTVIVPHYTFQQIQDGNTGNTGWKYRKYTNHRMEIQQRHQNTPNTRLAKALKRHHSIWCRAHWCRWSGHAVASHCAALRIISKAANTRWKYWKYTKHRMQILQIRYAFQIRYFWWYKKAK